MKKLFFYKLLIVLVMIIVWSFCYTKLPDVVPTHWWPSWLPDATWNKLINIVLFPALTLLIVILFPILSKIDPRKENYEKFAKVWEIFQFSIIWFFAYMYFVILYLSLNPEISITKFMMFWLWVLFIIIWNYLWKIRQNYFVGIKLPWTIENEEVWNKTHRFSGKLFLFWWTILFISWFLGFYPILVFIITLIFIIIVPVLYSYVIYKRLWKK